MPAVTASVANRYGDSADRRRRSRWLLIGLGAFIAVVMIAWAVWGAGLGTATASMQGTAVSSRVVDPSHVEVTIQVDAPPHTKVSCAVQAQNIDFTTVGYAVIHLPASDKTSRVLSRTLVTYEPAVSGSLDKCWLP